MLQKVKPKTIVDNIEKRYSVGILAEGNCVLKGYEELYLDYLRLRARVYVNQTGMLNQESILDDGTERDEDDARSVHFGVIEDTNDGLRVVAALRLIQKNEFFSNPLPIEEYFPNLFSKMPIPLKNVELSRYICQHENKVVQFTLTWPLFSAAAYYCNKYNINCTYAIIEPFLERILSRRGISSKRLAESKFVPRYNNFNIPVIFNNKVVTNIIDSRNPGIVDKVGNSNGKFVRFGI